MGPVIRVFASTTFQKQNRKKVTRILRPMIPFFTNHVPKGPRENSPPFQRWVTGFTMSTSPGGAKERVYESPRRIQTPARLLAYPQDLAKRLECVRFIGAVHGGKANPPVPGIGLRSTQSGDESPQSKRWRALGNPVRAGTQSTCVSLLALFYHPAESSLAAQTFWRFNVSTFQRFNDFVCGSAALCSSCASW
jgi:hypothetical protein